MKRTNDKIALTVLILFLMFASFYTGQTVGIEKGREYGKQDRHKLRRMSTDYKVELNRCRSWVDQMGAELQARR